MRLLYCPESSSDERLVRALGELHRVEAARDLEDGLTLARISTAEAVICDLGQTPSDIIARFRRAAPQAWLVAILPAGREEAHIGMLRAGADAVFTRPYVFRELSARLDAFARRAVGDAAQGLELSLEPSDRAVLISGERVRLSEREFALFALLVGRSGQVAALEEILQAVWGEDASERPELVHTYVARLRGKLERGRPWRLIHGARGHGYRFAITPAEGTAT